MKKYNPCLGMASTQAEANELIKKLGHGHAVKSGGFWRVLKYVPKEVGRNSVYTKDHRGNPQSSDKGSV